MISEPITKAINEHCKLTFVYKGHTRIVDPHVYGVSKNVNGLQCWQTGGTSSSSKKIPGWRLFHVAKISNITQSDQKFTPQLKMKPNKAFSRIYLSIWDQ